MFLSFCSCKKKEQQTLPPKEVKNTITQTINNSKLKNDSLSNESIPNQIVPTSHSKIINPSEPIGFTLLAEMTALEFESIKGAELEMKMVRPIYSEIFDRDEDDSQVIPLLSPGQKALYHFRKMDEILMEGGIDQLFSSALADHLGDIHESLSVLKHSKLNDLTKDLQLNYLLSRQLKVDGESDINSFKKNFNSSFQKNKEEFYLHLEDYIRSHPEEFINFKD